MLAPQIQGLHAPTQLVLDAHVQSVRFFMRDMAELNLLLKGQESSDRQIAWATMDFLSGFNGTPPLTGFSLNDMMSMHQQHFCVRGTVISLLEGLMLIYSRNYVAISDGGIAANINDKAPIIQSILGLLQASYEQRLRLLKTTLNIAQVLNGGGGVRSDYSLLYTSSYY